jgi:rRNA biogenesis protein RRP5
VARREDGERFNIWVAWLNLENLHGTEDATLSLLSRALTHTDPRRMYLAAVDVFERTQRAHLVEQCLKAMTRKFGEEVEVRNGPRNGGWFGEQLASRRPLRG